MLLGRAEEQARLDNVVADARKGVGGALLLRGEPGIGKSELLGYAAGRAADYRVLKATGVESETELPFSGLAELCNPVLDLIGSILNLPDAVMGLALNRHLGRPILGVYDEAGMVACAALAIGGVILCAIGMRRRDIGR